MSSINFYEETVQSIKHAGKTLSDILYVTIQDGKYYKPENFLKAIKEITYDNGSGGQVIHEDLQIVFKDGSYLYRDEYDGSEWWNYSPVQPLNVTLEDFTETEKLFESYYVHNQGFFTVKL